MVRVWLCLMLRDLFSRQYIDVPGALHHTRQHGARHESAGAVAGHHHHHHRHNGAEEGATPSNTKNESTRAHRGSEVAHDALPAERQGVGWLSSHMGVLRSSKPRLHLRPKAEVRATLRSPLWPFAHATVDYSSFAANPHGQGAKVRQSKSKNGFLILNHSGLDAAARGGVPRRHPGRSSRFKAP